MRLRTLVRLLVLALIAGALVYLVSTDLSDRPQGPGRDPTEADAPGLAPLRTAQRPTKESAARTTEPSERPETPEEREKRLDEAAFAQKLPPKEAVPRLVRALRNPDHPRWKIALQRLTDLGPEAAPAVPALIQCLQDKRLRHGAASTLCQMGAAAYAADGALRTCLDTDDKAFRAIVARAIWTVSGEAGPTIDVLIEVLDSGPIFAPQFAACSLGRMGRQGAEGVPALVERLTRETTPMVDRTQIYFGLGQIGTDATEALPHARKDLESEHLKLRSAAAYAVFRLSGDVVSTLPILIQAVEKGDRHVSMWAAGNIGDLGAVASPAVSALRKARDEGIQRIQGPAASSLHRITGDPKEALPLFVEELRVAGPYAADYAQRLGEMGRDALPAVPVLEAAMNFENYRLRRAARDALEKIRGE